MTEDEWRAGDDPTKMLAFVGGRVSERRCWAFVAACTRRLPRAAMTDGLVGALDVASQYADGTASEYDLRSVYPYGKGAETAGYASRLALRMTNDANRDRERDEQVLLIRCVFPDPFRPAVFLGEWRTSTAVGLAEGIYADHAFDRLPILADALQDAGCEDEKVLGHCREGGFHDRGCWLMDSVLGRA